MIRPRSSGAHIESHLVISFEILIAWLTVWVARDSPNISAWLARITKARSEFSPLEPSCWYQSARANIGPDSIITLHSGVLRQRRPRELLLRVLAERADSIRCVRAALVTQRLIVADLHNARSAKHTYIYYVHRNQQRYMLASRANTHVISWQEVGVHLMRNMVPARLPFWCCHSRLLIKM
jgi:hypothetical protein